MLDLVSFNCSLLPAFLDRYVQYNAAISCSEHACSQVRWPAQLWRNLTRTSNRAGTKQLSHRKCVNESIKHKVQVGTKFLRLSSKLLNPSVFRVCV